MYTVLDESLMVKGRLSLNNGQGSTSFFGDTITTQLATDNANDPTNLTTNDYTNQDKQGNAKQWSHSLTISFESTDLGTSITTNDYLMYFDDVVNHYYLMKVLGSDTDRSSGYITATAINAAIYELGKQLIQTEQTLSQVDLKTFVTKMYKNAPFSLQIADNNLTTVDYTISANTSLQALLQDLQTKFNVDVDSWVEVDNTGHITDRVLYFGNRGRDNGELIRYGGAKGFEAMTATEVSDIIYTKLYVTGKTDDKDTTKGHIGTVNNGLEYIVDDEANQKLYAIGASQQQPVYLEGAITNNLLSEPQSLLDWAKEQMAIFNHPRFNYTVTPLHDQNVTLGDIVTVQDFHIKPMILVNSKVIQKTTSFASPETNTFVLGEFSSIFTDNMNRANNVITLIKKDVTVVEQAAQDASNKAEIARQQADAAHDAAVQAASAAYNAQVSADGKAVILTVKSLDELPQTAKEGTQAWYDAENGTYLYVFLNGKWVKRIDPDMADNITNGVNKATSDAKAYTDQAIATNDTNVSASIKAVDDKANALKADQTTFDNKAQGYANQAKSDAINSANQAVKESSDNASANLAQAKTDITSAYEAADGTINKKIDDTANSITTTISQNKEDADGKISTAQTTAQQAVDGLKNKVSQSDYDKKTGDLDTRVSTAQQTADTANTTIGNYKQSNDGRVSAAESAINQNATDISSKVSQGDYNAKTGQIDANISQINQKADSIEQTVTQVSGKVDNLKVGGRNLLLGTQGWTGSVWDYSGIPIDPSNTYNALVIAETSSAWNSPKYKPQSIADRGLWVGDKDYVFSAYVRNTSDTDVYVYPFADLTNISFTPSNTATTIKAHSDWTRVSSILRVNNQVDLNNPLRWEAGTSVTTGKIQLAGYKLELGNVLTDWSPAPEDIDNKFSTQQQTIDGFSNVVSNVQNKVDNLQVGGRNLLFQTQTFNFSYGNNQADSITLEDFDSTTKMMHIVSSGGKSNVGIYTRQQSNLNIKKGQTFTFSMDIKGTAIPTIMGLEQHQGATTQTGTIGSDWSRVSFTGISNNDNSAVVVYFSPNNEPIDVYIKLLKLEQATIATAYTPAPEDTDDSINKVSTRVQTAEGEISTAQDNISGLQSKQTQTADGLSKEVTDRQNGDSSVLQQGKDFTSQTVSSSENNMKSLINQKADSATIGVIQNDVNTLKANTQWQRIERFDDMNFMTQSGRFFIGASNNTNSAVSASFYIMVDAPQSDRITQTQWKDLDGSLMYRRTYNGSSWTPWTQMVMSSTLLNIFHDSWSLGTSTNDGITKQLITGINGQADGTLVLSGKSVVLNSDTVIGNNFIIGSAQIANGAIGTAQIGDAAITSAKIANLDVSKLTGDTITGFNINANRQIKIASGGALISDVVNMDKTNFSVSAPNISSYRFSSEKYKVSTSNGIFNINSVLGVFSSDGNISVAVDANSDPYKKGVFHSEYGGNNLMMSATNYTNGDPDEQLNMSSARLDYMYSKTGFLSDATDHTSIRANLIETTGTLNAFSGAQIPNIYSYPNLILESKNQSVYFKSGGDYRLQIRENGYIYLWNKKFGSGGSSLQVAGDGALFIQSSATKFKEDIQYDGGTSVGDKFLTLDPATWQDKAEYEARAKYRKIGTEPDHQIHMDDKRYYGLIAEDLVKAGLEEFVVRDENTGEVNGLEYDKVAISMIPVIRSQRDAINELKAEVERLKDKVK